MGWVQFMTSSCLSLAARGFPSREGDDKVDNQLDPGNGVRALGGRDHPGIRISQSPPWKSNSSIIPSCVPWGWLEAGNRL